MLLETGEMDKDMAGNKPNKKESSKSEENEFKESEDKMRRVEVALIARMEEASIDLADTESEEDSTILRTHSPTTMRARIIKQTI